MGNLVNEGLFGAGIANLNPNGAQGLAAAINPARVAIDWTERYPYSPRSQRYKDNGSQVIREYIVPWGNPGVSPTFYFDAVKDLLGYPILMQGPGGGRYISRALPDNIPWLTQDDSGLGILPPRPFLWCTEIAELKGADVVPGPEGRLPGAGGTLGLWLQNVFNNGFLTAVYETLTYDHVSDGDMVRAGYTDEFGNPDESAALDARFPRYMTVTPGPGTRYQTLPFGSFVIAAPQQVPLAGPTPYPGQPGRLELECDVEVVWHQVPTAAIPFRLVNPYVANKVGVTDYVPAIERCLGTVNLTPFMGCKKGTLLLTGVAMRRIRSSIGMRLWDVIAKWKWFHAQSALGATANNFTYGHNNVLYIQGPTIPPGYYEIVTDQTNGTSNYSLPAPVDYVNLFPYRDHRQIFQMPPLIMDPGNT